MFKLRKKYVPTHRRAAELTAGDRLLVFGKYLTVFRVEENPEVLGETVLHMQDVHKWPYYSNTIVMSVPSELLVETHNWNQEGRS